MCCGNNGGGCVRGILVSINIFFFLIGAVIFTVGGILKWHNFDFLTELIDESEGIINVTEILEGSTLILLIFGGILIGVSVIGLIGTCCGLKSFLIVYEIILIVVFVLNLVLFIMGMVKGNELKQKYQDRMNKSVNSLVNITQLTSIDDLTDDLKKSCLFIKGISVVFSCCAYNGIRDLPNVVVPICCKDDADASTAGCGIKVVDLLDKYGLKVFLGANIAFLVLEICFMIAVPYVIFRISKRNRDKDKSNAPTNSRPANIQMYPYQPPQSTMKF